MVLGIKPAFRRALLLPIDLGVDIFQALRVLGAEVLAAGNVGDLLERLLVQREHFLAKHAASEGVGIRIGNGDHAIAADADRIDLDAQRLGDLCSLGRLQYAGRLLAVGQEDDHFALGVRVLEAIGGHGQRIADGGLRVLLPQPPVDLLAAIIEDGMGDLHLFEHLDECAVIERQRASRLDKTAERDQTDEVVRPARQLALSHDKVLEYLLDDGQAIDLLTVDIEIQCGHRSGAIDAHFNGDPLGVDAELFDAMLRTSQGRDHQPQPREADPGQRPFDPQRQRGGQGPQKAHVGIKHRHAALPADRQDADRPQCRQQQEPQGILEADVHAATSSLPAQRTNTLARRKLSSMSSLRG